MSWWPVFLGGARVVAMPTTALLVLCSGPVGGLLPMLLLLAAARSSAAVGGLLVVLAIAWAYLAHVFLGGAVASVAAEERPSFSGVLGTTLSRYGSYLGSSLVILGVALFAVVAMLGMAQLGRIGGPGTVFLALLTPVLAVVGSAVVLWVPNAHQLAFAAVSVDGAGPVDAVKFALTVLRDRRGELLLWIAGSTALLVGLFLGIVLPVVVGFSVGNAVLLVDLLAADEPFGVFGVTPSDSAAAGVLASSLGSLFLWTVLGLWSSFATASAVHFRRALAAGAGTGSKAGSFCELCGTRLSVGARFCDGCGAQARAS